MTAPGSFQIQFGTASEHVRLDLPGSLAELEQDAIRAEVVLSRFRCDIRPWVDWRALQSFAMALRALYENLAGNAELQPLDRQLLLQFQAQPAGHILLRGEAWEEATYGSCLSFQLELDQSFLLAPLQALETMLNC